MAITGDRQAASLLSALAEAPDSAAASSFLATQLAEMGGAGRVVILRLDAAQESFVTVAANELADAPPAAIGDRRSAGQRTLRRVSGARREVGAGHST